MRLINLQKFADATPIQGKQLVYAIRVLDDAATDAAQILSFTTENNRSVSKDADTTATKDGSIRTTGATEIEITGTAKMVKGGTLYDKIEAAMKNDKLFEVWEINRAEPGTSGNEGKYKANYYQGYMTSWEIASSAEDYVEVSWTFGANGEGKTGYATLTAEQEAAADYVRSRLCIC